LGWNKPYNFDESDFEIGNQQLTQFMRAIADGHKAAPSRQTTLASLRYFYADINYGGLIWTPEDQKLLQAIINDLMTD
jgi:hypothetical protein